MLSTVLLTKPGYVASLSIDVSYIDLINNMGHRNFEVNTKWSLPYLLLKIRIMWSPKKILSMWKRKLKTRPRSYKSLSKSHPRILLRSAERWHSFLLSFLSPLSLLSLPLPFLLLPSVSIFSLLLSGFEFSALFIWLCYWILISIYLFCVLHCSIVLVLQYQLSASWFSLLIWFILILIFIEAFRRTVIVLLGFMSLWVQFYVMRYLFNH